jgi:hypothetical protein
MSSSTLTQIQVQMIRIGCPICVVIGNLDCILGLFVFLQKSMRNNPCIIFLIGYMVTNLIYIDFTVLSTAFAGYGMDMSIISHFSCCMRTYMSYVFSACPSWFLVMASMDRMFVSSSNAQIRNRSNKRFALIMLIGNILFWLIFHIQAFFISEIVLLYGVRLYCTTRPGAASTFAAYYGPINALIPITLMTLFGIQTLINIKRTRRNHTNSQNQRLIGLLFGQIFIYIFLRLPISIYLIYGQITKSYAKSSNRVAIENFVDFVVVFCQFTQVSISPLMNLVTNSFRIELRRAVYKTIGRRNDIDGTSNSTRNVNTNQVRQMRTRFNNTNAVHIETIE